MRLHSRSPEATARAAQLLAAALPSEGLLVVLSGALGAGKTAFAKGIAHGLGLDPAQVASPTFAICSEYELAGARRLAHLDGYRLSSAAELEAAGFLDLLVPGTVVLIEWGERFRSALPADRLEIELRAVDGAPTHRRLDAVASGPAADRVLARWEAALAREREQEGARAGLAVLDESVLQPASGCDGSNARGESGARGESRGSGR